MIGPRVGLKTDVRVGLAVGLDQDHVTLLGVPRDGPFGSIYVPQTAADFTALALTPPNTAMWQFQEPSGAIVDSIGGFNLTALGAGHLYRQAVAGWTRWAVKNTDATANQRWGNTAVPTLATNSYMRVSYWLPPAVAPAGTRRIGTFGVGTQFIQQMILTPRIRNTCAGVNVDGTNDPTSVSVRPLVELLDRNAGLARTYTDQEKISGTYSATVTGQQVAFGADASAPPNQGWLWSALWTGVTAETFGDAGVKALLQTLGWTIPWI